MRKKTISSFLWMAIIVFLLAGCKSFKDKPDLTTPAFHPEISACTAGVISSRAVITIELANDYEGVFEVLEPVQAKLFEFSPKLKGTAYWLNARTLEFRPEGPLPNGQLYAARFHIGKILDLPNDLARFDFSFQVISQAFAVELDGMEAAETDNGGIYRFSGVLLTSDYMEEDEAGSLLKAFQGERSLPIRWVQNPGATRHSFVIDSLLRRQETDYFRITWDGRPFGINLHDEYITKIPALDVFSVMSVRVIQHPEQHVQIWLSDPLTADQQLDGLVEISGIQSARYRAEGNRLYLYPASRVTGTYTLTLHRGLRSSRGTRLAADASYDVVFEDVKPAVRLSGHGVIIPESNGLIFPFEAVNLRAVDLRIIKIFENNVGQFLQVNALDGDNELKRAGRLIMQRTIPLISERPLDFGNWNSFSFDLSDLIKTEPGAIYRIEIGFRKEHSLYPCGDMADASEGITMSDSYPEDDITMAYWDDPDMYWDPAATFSWWESWFDWEQRDNPCHDSYFGRQRTVGRNVLASNLGIIAKGGHDNKMVFAVSDLRTTTPLANVKLDVYNYQHQLTGSVITDQEGMAVLGVDMKPYLLVASLDKQRGYVRLDDGSALSLSRFDVSGEQVQKGIKGFIYADRGVWRPGDSLHVTFILEDKLRQLPANHPVSFEFYNPAGQLVSRQSTGTGLNGFYYFRTVTSTDAPTGNWRGIVRVGGAVFSRIFKIETVKPNRLKIDLDFREEILGVHQPDAMGHLQVSWLHGAAAKNLRADVQVITSQVPTKFTGFPDYIFDDPSKSFVAGETTIFDARLDAQGYASIRPPLSASSAAPGMLQVHLTTRVFEESGGFSIDRLTLPFSPYKTYVGIRVPQADSHTAFLSNNQSYQVDLVTVDHTGRLVPARKLDVDVYKLEWRWWWDTGGESLASYMGSTYPRPVYTERVVATNGRGSFQFRMDQPDWGRYLIRVLDTESGHSTGQVVFVDWPGEYSRSAGADPELAAMLSISADKQTYEVGDMVHVTLPGVRQGRALVSLESGSRVIESWWEEPREGELTFSFPANASMSPNVYLHVSLIQPHAQTLNDLPIRMYGVLPLLVEDPATKLSPVLDMPARLIPEQEVSIRVKEANGKRMTYTLAVVDEGLLDLTRFQTPSPWDAFYAREALGIHTWDIYNHVLGASAGRIEQVFSIGGDEAIVGAPRPQANRFKPVVKFLGPFTLDRNRTNNHRFFMPPYVGSVRVMLVAGDQGAYGHTEKTVAVNKPLMVLSTLPRIISPGERITMPVTVFAMEEELKNVQVSVSTNDLFLAPRTGNKQVIFDQPGDRVINFELEAGKETGVGVVRVDVSAGNERASHEIEIDIRNPNPPIHHVEAGLAEPAMEIVLDYSPVGMAGTNTVLLELSSLPPVDLGRRLRYLVNYPHGCLEQITSSAFPQLYLDDLMDTDTHTKQLTEAHIREAIRLVASYQRPDGGLRYWPGSSDVSDWGTSYAGHFMLEAAMKGYALPLRFREAWISYQSIQARAWSPVTSGGRHAAVRQDHLLQAYRLFTLALAGSPELGAMNRMREADGMSLQARWRLAAAYILAGQPEAANQLIEGRSWEVPDYSAFNPSYGSDIRDMAMILETLILMNRRDEAFPVLQKVSAALSSGQWMSTQTTAYSLLAFARYAGGSARSEGVQASVRINDDSALPVLSEKYVFQQDMRSFADIPARIRVLNESQSPLFVRVIAEGVPDLEAVTPASNNLQASVRFLGANKQQIDVDRLIQGTDLMAEITVRNPGMLGAYSDMVLTQFFPAGWEIRNTRMENANQHTEADVPTYQDIRDDRVHIHFDLNAGQSKKFVVRLHAAYLGRYYMPGTFGYAMYHDDVYTRLPGKWVEVVVPGE
jgi:alpha-2-macroglobulin